MAKMTFNVTVLKLFIGCENLRENTKTWHQLCALRHVETAEVQPEHQNGKES